MNTAIFVIVATGLLGFGFGVLTGILLGKRL